MKKSEAFIVANALSLSRGLLALAGVKATVDGNLLLATGLLSAGWATDIADGEIARKNEVESKVGWWNDRINDAIFFPAVFFLIGSQLGLLGESGLSAPIFMSVSFVSWLTTRYIMDHNKGLI